MPITIGSQTDVPATGDPIVSPWYQDTATKLVHHFATTAARDAWTTRPEGALAYTQADDNLWCYRGTAWVAVNFLTALGYLQIGGDANNAVAGVIARTDGVVISRVEAPDVATTPNLVLDRGGSPAADTNAYYATFKRSSSVTTVGTTIGSISVASGTSVSYLTTSDPRTKTPPPATRGIDDAAARAHALGATAWRGQYLDPDSGEATGDTTDFLSSHDIEAAAGYAVTGERDATDDDGNPVYQQVDYPALVPLLFAALADAFDRIAALEAAAP